MSASTVWRELTSTQQYSSARFSHAGPIRADVQEIGGYSDPRQQAVPCWYCGEATAGLDAVVATGIELCEAGMTGVVYCGSMAERTFRWRLRLPTRP